MGVKKWRRYSQHVTRGPRWKALRQQALRRDGFRCVKCGARGRLEVDHVKPVRTHPELSYALDNLQVLCGSCHSRKTKEEIGLNPTSPERKDWKKAVKLLEESRRQKQNPV